MAMAGQQDALALVWTARSALALQLAEIAVQVKTVQALQVEHHLPVEHVEHRDRHRSLQPGRHWQPPGRGLQAKDALTCTVAPAEPKTSAVSGRVCLGDSWMRCGPAIRSVFMVTWSVLKPG
jgi:hypothetical protein